MRMWLSAPDPSLNHNDAVGKRGRETGLWFIKSDMFSEWRTAPHSFLWIHGIRMYFLILANQLGLKLGDSWLR